MLACADALRKGGVAKMSVFVTHGLFPRESWHNLEHAGFEKIFITDSIPETAKNIQLQDGKSPFEVIGLAPLLHQYLSTV